MPNFLALLASITRCNAVYEADDAKARAAFAALGCTVLGRLDTPDAQAVAHIAPDGVPTLTISGTRISDSPTIDTVVDLFQDAEEAFANYDLGGGAIVASGAFTRGALIWSWCRDLLGPRPIRIEGHSLGGQTTHALLAIVPVAMIAEAIAWEPPKAGNDEFWGRCGLASVTTVINGADPWAAHPWDSKTLFHPPGPILWLHSGGWEFTTRDKWPGGEVLHAADHDPDVVTRVIVALTQV